MWEEINKYANSYSLISNIVMVLVTIAYVVINSLMHKEMKKNRERTERPEISIRFERVMSGYYDIVIENFGSNEVFDLVFNKIPIDLPVAFDRQTGFLHHGIKYMAPKQVFKSIYLDYRSIYAAGKHNEIMEFQVSYKDNKGQSFQKTFDFNLNLFYDIASISKGSPNDMHDVFTQISKSLEKIANKA